MDGVRKKRRRAVPSDTSKSSAGKPESHDSCEKGEEQMCQIERDPSGETSDDKESETALYDEAATVGRAGQDSGFSL